MSAKITVSFFQEPFDIPLQKCAKATLIIIFFPQQSFAKVHQSHLCCAQLCNRNAHRCEVRERVSRFERLFEVTDKNRFSVSSRSFSEVFSSANCQFKGHMCPTSLSFPFCLHVLQISQSKHQDIRCRGSDYTFFKFVCSELLSLSNPTHTL